MFLLLIQITKSLYSYFGLRKRGKNQGGHPLDKNKLLTGVKRGKQNEVKVNWNVNNTADNQPWFSGDGAGVPGCVGVLVGVGSLVNKLIIMLGEMKAENEL